MSAKKWNTVRLTIKTVRGMRLRTRRGTTNVPRTLHAVANTMKAPITAATTRMAMPQLGMARRGTEEVRCHFGFNRHGAGLCGRYSDCAAANQLQGCGDQTARTRFAPSSTMVSRSCRREPGAKCFAMDHFLP